MAKDKTMAKQHKATAKETKEKQKTTARKTMAKKRRLRKIAAKSKPTVEQIPSPGLVPIPAPWRTQPMEPEEEPTDPAVLLGCVALPVAERPIHASVR